MQRHFKTGLNGKSVVSKTNSLSPIPMVVGQVRLHLAKTTKFVCDGAGINKSWNAQGDPPHGVQEYVKLMIAHCRTDHRRHPKPISDQTRQDFCLRSFQGGIFAYRLACDLSTLAAIGVTAATLTDVSCHPSHAVSIFHVHNLQDPVIPFGEDDESNWPPVTPGLEFWAK